MIKVGGPRRAVAALVGLSIVSGTTVLVAPSASAQPRPAAIDAKLSAFYQQKVAWARCKALPSDPKPVPGEPPIPWHKLECATVTVPLDYRRPAAGKLRIAVSRMKAKAPAKRQGVLLLNPGGPGGDGLTLPLAFETRPIAASFDQIGFDPRGVGRSTRLMCEYLPDVERSWNRPTEAQMRIMASDARKREQACQRAGGGIRPFINTANTARDMDVIRGVLGEKKINFLGFSYGTYLGAVYGSLFPARLNRSVLDSSVHPKWIWQPQFEQQSVAARQNVDAWVPWVAQRNKTYGFGTTAPKVTALLDSIGGKLAVKPVQIEVPIPGGIMVMYFDRDTFDAVLGEFTRYRDGWDLLGVTVKALRTAVNAPPGPGSKLSPDARRALGLLTKLAIAPTIDGVFQTVTCEADWPRSLDRYYARMRLFAKRYPYGQGAAAAAPTECTFRSFALPERPVTLRRAGYPSGVVVQSEGDTQTQYDGGPAMASTLGHSLISVPDDGQHGLYGSNDCVTEYVEDYLINGVLPSSRTECPGTPRPDVPADTAAGAGAPSIAAKQSLEAQARALITRRNLSRRHWTS